MAAEAAGGKISKLTEKQDESLVSTLLKMTEEAAETAQRCEKVAGGFEEEDGRGGRGRTLVPAADDERVCRQQRGARAGRMGAADSGAPPPGRAPGVTDARAEQDPNELA
jgi:hypothetical protein